MIDIFELIDSLNYEEPTIRISKSDGELRVVVSVWSVDGWHSSSFIMGKGDEREDLFKYRWKNVLSQLNERVKFSTAAESVIRYAQGLGW